METYVLDTNQQNLFSEDEFKVTIRVIPKILLNFLNVEIILETS